MKMPLLPVLAMLFASLTTIPAFANDGDSANLALVKSGYAAAAVGDMAAVMNLLAPDIVWNEAETLPYGGVHHGPEAVMQQVFAAIGQDWNDYAAEPLRFIDGGDQIVVLGEYRGVHNTSGGQLQAPFAHIWRLDNGRLIEFHQFTDTALWLFAAGIAEPRQP